MTIAEELRIELGGAIESLVYYADYFRLQGQASEATELSDISERLETFIAKAERQP